MFIRLTQQPIFDHKINTIIIITVQLEIQALYNFINQNGCHVFYINVSFLSHQFSALPKKSIYLYSLGSKLSGKVHKNEYPYRTF